MIDEKYIWAYTLKNATEHDGNAKVGSVIPGLFNCGLEKNDIKKIMPKVKDIVKKVNSKKLDEQLKLLNDYKDLIGSRPQREGLPDFFEVEKSGIITRFSPSPSGPMHIGHIMSGLITSLYLEKYGGKFYLQIEDTNPENIYTPAYKMIPDEADWIFGNVTDVIIQSDRIKIYYKYVEKLLDKNSVYVCTCDSEEFKKLIDSKKPCPCRELDKKENKQRWKKMLDKNGFKAGVAVLRFKSDINDSNPAMRDFPLARISTTSHPRQKNKYRVWPLMNLAVTVDDIVLKKTHVIRAKDHKDNSKRQKMIYSALGLEKVFPETYFLGRYNFTDLEISASKTKKAIEDKKFNDWDDIRLPFVASLKKRGYQRAAFVKLVEQRGLSEVDKVITKKDFYEILDNFNREVLKDVAIKADYKKSSEKKSNTIILMPNNKEHYAITTYKPKKDQIVYFPRFGYAKYQGKFNKKLYFWFCHA